MSSGGALVQLFGELGTLFSDTLARFDQDHIIFRLWAKDSSIFTGHDEASMLDWLNEPAEIQISLPALKAIKNDISSHNFSATVLLGMGGSSLSPKVFQAMLAPESTESFYVLDTIHPDAIARLSRGIDLKKTLFIVASKSGSTLEPNLLYRYFLSRLIEEGAQDPYQHFMAITDPVTSLEQESMENGFLKGPFGKPGIGGRYSGLSPFGILPAWLMGIDVERLLKNAVAMEHATGPSVLAQHNPAGPLGAFLATCVAHAKDQLLIHLSPALASFGMWLEQLIAESLGKNGTGIVPIIADADDDSPSIASAHIVIGLASELSAMPALKRDHEKDAAIFRITINDEYEVGALMFRFQMAVALTASVLKINPFNQPDVEKSKLRAKEIIAKIMNGIAPIEEAPPFDLGNLEIFGDLAGFFAHVGRTDYCAVLSYLDETWDHVLKLKTLKSAIAQKTQSATMLQTGPRYLHSTGQLFKGGKNNGHFLVITGPYAEDRPSGMGVLSLGDVHLSQALGDILALRESGRRVLHIRLKDITFGLHDLIKVISALVL